jgi:hypothetical protein
MDILSYQKAQKMLMKFLKPLFLWESLHENCLLPFLREKNRVRDILLPDSLAISHFEESVHKYTHLKAGKKLTVKSDIHFI